MTQIINPTYLDVLKSARRKLLRSPKFISLLGTDVGQDSMFPGVYGGGFNDAWLFYGIGETSAPERSPANTGTSAITMDLRTNWGTPNFYNTADFRILRFTIYSDLSRTSLDSNGLIAARDAEDRCDRIAQAIKSEFDDVANETHWWDDVYINNCSLYTALTIMDEPGEDGLVRGDIRFKLTLV